MAQSLTAIYVHIIFSTKDRTPWIDDSLRLRLWQYLGGICNSEDCVPVKIGGTSDHIHILCRLSKNTNVSNLINLVKTNSSKWIKSILPEHAVFSWQNGYGVFSVNPQETEKVIEYIDNQKQHHIKRGFCEEFLIFVKKYGIEYDEKYLWN